MWFDTAPPTYDWTSCSVACFSNAAGAINALLNESECTYTVTTQEHTNGKLFVFSAQFRTHRDRTLFLSRVSQLWALRVAIVKNGSVLEWLDEYDEDEELPPTAPTRSLLEQWRTEDLEEVPYDPPGPLPLSELSNPWVTNRSVWHLAAAASAGAADTTDPVTRCILKDVRNTAREELARREGTATLSWLRAWRDRQPPQ